MDQKQKNLLVVCFVFAVLIFSLGLLIGLYERNYSGYTPPITTYGRNGTKQVTFLFDKLRVPNDGSAYCRQFNLESTLKSKLHGIQFQPVVDNPQIVNHIYLYACTSPSVSYQDTFQCNTVPAACNYLIYQWGPGAGPLTFPDQAGLSFDSQNAYGKYFLLQIRYSYDTPDAPSVIDNSGVFVNLTSTLRQYDGGLLPVGARDSSVAIPTANPAFEVIGACNSDATLTLLGASSIQLFASSLYAHSYGKTIWLEQTTGSTVNQLARADPYTTAAQQVYPLQTELKPGDSLTVHCVYDSGPALDTIQGGPAASQEQCLAYLSYYPALTVPNYCLDSTYRAVTAQS